MNSSTDPGSMRVPAYSADRAAPPVRRDRLRRVYLSLRFLAYGLGLAGAALAYFGRMAEPALQKKLFGVGAGLMITMFLIFLVSHGLYLFMKFGASPRS